MIAADPSAAAAMARLFLVVAAVLALFAVTAMASDADNINDYCPTDLKSMLTINGLSRMQGSQGDHRQRFLVLWLRGGRYCDSGGIATTPGFALLVSTSPD